MLTEKDKKEMLEDARLSDRRDDFRRLSKNKYNNFTIEFLEEITGLIPTAYPRHIIKTDRNRL